MRWQELPGQASVGRAELPGPPQASSFLQEEKGELS